jgi:predicted dehydrogenase
MRNKIRLAVIGCGAVSTLYHLPAAASAPNVELVAVHDYDRARAQKAASEFKARVCERLEQLPGMVDAALVATPNRTHAGIVENLLQAGVSVLCEKPLTTTAEEAKRLYELASHANGRLMAAHSRRFAPQTRALVRLIRGGRLGQVKSLSLSLGGRLDGWASKTDFRKNKNLAGGGALIDSGVHLIDLAVWIMGANALSVTSTMERFNGWEVEDFAEVRLEFPDKVEAHIACAYCWPMSNRLKVEGTEGWAVAALNGVEPVKYFNPNVCACAHSGVLEIVYPDEDSYRVQLMHFAEALLKDQEFSVKAEEVVEGLRIIELCYQQAQELREFQTA